MLTVDPDPFGPTQLTHPHPVDGPGVYCITDDATGRFYVGSSVNIAKRWRQHTWHLQRGTHPNPILQAIWNADSARLAIGTVTQTASADKGALLAAEQALLDACGAGRNRHCMNVLAIAGSHLGRKRSDETKQRLAAAQRGKTASPQARAKMRAAKLGKPLSADHRKKLGDVARGRKINRPKGIVQPAQRALNAEQVRALRRRRHEGASWRELGVEFGLCRGAARRAAIGETYAEVRP